MNIKSLFLALSLMFIPIISFGAAKAVIVGPNESKPGDLIILDASRSEGLAFQWVLTNSNKTYLPVEKGTKVVFSSGDPGEYIFVLVVGGEDNNKNLVVDTAQHKVVITGNPSPGPTPGPGPNPPPVPVVTVPDGKFSISPKVLTWAKDTGDKTTALKLSMVFEAISAQIAAGGLQTPEDIIKETANKNKEATGNQFETWKTKFFTPLNVELNKLANDENKIKTLEDHATCWKEIAIGLKAYGESK